MCVIHRFVSFFNLFVVQCPLGSFVFWLGVSNPLKITVHIGLPYNISVVYLVLARALWQTPSGASLVFEAYLGPPDFWSSHLTCLYKEMTLA